MRRWLFIVFVCLIAACKKNNLTAALDGVWVEKTQRLDTIRFHDLVFSTPEPATFDLRSHTSAYSSLYNYKFKADSILLRSYFSSYDGFYSYYFKQDNSSLFTVSNFFNPSLPSILQFERIR